MPLKHNAKSKPKSKSYFGGGSDGSDSDSDTNNSDGDNSSTGGAGSDAGSDYDDNENDDEEGGDFNAEEEEAAKKNKKAGVAVALDEDLGEDAVDVGDLEEDLEDEDLEEDDDDDEDDDQYVESDEEDEGVKPSKLQGKKVKAVNVYSNEDDSEGAGDDDGDGEDDEDPDENYLQKFNAEINKNYITDFHPECIISNYDEVATLAVVVRDATGMIVDDLHRTLPYLTKYERARILGQRAKQINAGAPAFVKVPEKVIDGYLIAEMELANKTIPFIIRRPLPNGGSEYWRVNDLENIGF
jgi:DNA-directed RNA polymerase subunit K/omega